MKLENLLMIQLNLLIQIKIWKTFNRDVILMIFMIELINKEVIMSI